MVTSKGGSKSTKGNENDYSDDGTQLTYNETIDTICGFIKTSIHTILCHRQVYPPNVFTRRQRYRVPVWSSRHPGLTTYIDDLIQALKTQIQKNSIESVHLVIQSLSTGNILERYRFDLNFILAGIPLRDRDFSIPGNMNSNLIELNLRSFMMKLISIDGALFDLDNPEDLTWSLVLDMKEGLQPETDDITKGNEPIQGAWVPFDEDKILQFGQNDDQSPHSSSNDNHQSGSRPSYLRARKATNNSFNGEEEEDDVQIVPIKSLDTGVINLMLYVEEHPSAKRQSKISKTVPSSSSSLRRRRNESAGKGKENVELQDSIRAGERDIDEPLPKPSSSGAVLTKGKGGTKSRDTNKKKKGEGDDESDSSVDTNDDDDRGSSGSGESIQSVNDFAGYGKTPGGVGMSGVGM